MKLIIANKKYSSWSLRPWLAMKCANIPFGEVLIPFDMANGNPEFKTYSPTGKVPCLVDGDVTVWESLAILEYLAEKFPDRNLWPQSAQDRAEARSISNEMHSGFLNLRGACPMNMARTPALLEVNEGVRRDVSRIEQIWSQALAKSGGPFLFGDFSNADAVFAPVVNRLQIYCLSENDAVKRYTAAVTALPAWQEWQAAGKAEPWYVAEDEV